MKRLVQKIFSAMGLEVRRKQPAQVLRATMSGSLRQLSKLGFKPATLIDVGVAYDTAELYRAFPDAAILLIEPLIEFESSLQKICASRNASYVLAAAGEKPGTAVLNVHADMVGSSLLSEIEGKSIDGAPRSVPDVAIDQVVAERNLQGPYLMKVDVQGAELHVLAGATRTLQETEAVILEVSLFGMVIGSPRFFDVVERMKQYGFVAYDSCGFLYRPLDDALCQVDMLFVRENGSFRASHAYATPEQREAMSLTPGPQLAELENKSS